mmetsp:Transcript_20740/g.25686  ORF Transcript_20740/g.25686 Transcript_20740/m.25686 type:complete len:126 (-) Transcript_20740:1292-1669(-)
MFDDDDNVCVVVLPQRPPPNPRARTTSSRAPPTLSHRRYVVMSLPYGVLNIGMITANLTPEEKAKVNRNREHARNTRLRKKQSFGTGQGAGYHGARTGRGGEYDGGDDEDADGGVVEFLCVAEYV